MARRKYSDPTEEELVTITELMNTLKKSKYFSKLDLKHKRFVASYCTNTFNAKKAALAAGYVEKSAASFAGKLLSETAIKKAIQEFTKVYIGRMKEIMQISILETYRHRAFYKIGDFLNSDGSLINSNLADYGEKQVCIDGIETKMIRGKKQTIIKMADREAALTALAKYIDIMNTSIDININSGVLLVKPQKSLDEWKDMIK